MEKNRMPDEFGMPVDERATPPEPRNIPTEFTAPPEHSLPPSMEFGGRSGGAESEEAKSRHALIKQIMLLPVAATVATLSIVFSSFGYDPLGDDFLYQDERIEEEQEAVKEKDPSDQKDKDNPKGDKEYREVREYPGDITGVIIDVTYVPTGESYRAEETGEEGLEEARAWVLRQGGDPDTITYVGSEEIYAGIEKSDDAIIVGDEDDPAHWYVAQGTVTDVYKTVAYFNAYESMWIDEEPQGAQFTDLPILVVFVPTGDRFFPVETGDAGLVEAKEWVESIGGDPDSMQYVTIRRDTKYEIDDGVLSQIIMDFAYYEVTEYSDSYGEDSWFPILPNPDPDYAGDYAWNVNGPEWFITVRPRGDNIFYNVACGAGIAASFDTVDGAYYDPSTNTLTLDNFIGDFAEINLMGNGFTINLIGENSIRLFKIWGAGYGGSVRFTGTGSLVINEGYGLDNGGFTMEAERSDGCIMVDYGVTLEFYGSLQLEEVYPPISVKESKLRQTLYLAPDMELTAYRDRDSDSYGIGYMADDPTQDNERQIVYTQNGAIANYVRIAPR
ncbi:MAG: hypothetical protein J5546_07090 [Lachnospiraceae bacterium]|nr:hypothetical protein [Lachnospiraceae bacterium]